MKEGESTPSRPQSTAARDGHRAEAPRSSPLGRTSEPPTKLSDPISESRWHKFGRVALGYRRRAHATYIKALLSTDLRLQRTIQQVASKGSTLLATIVSVIISVLFYTIADSTDIKASEMHLAAAQIIGAALALVLSLSIIPAQRAAELFSISVLQQFAKDRALLGVFLILVATTMLSLLLGTRWSVRLDPKMSLVLQFLLLGISFDALRRFYVSTLNLLAPESAIRQIVRVSSAQIRRIGRAAEKVVAIQVVANGAPSKMDQTLHAQTIVRTRLPQGLQHSIAQLEKFAHRFIARRDSNATIETLGALETIATEYSDLRKKSITLHVDPKFPFAGYLSDVSDVLNPIYESILHIIEDAIAAKNERVVQHSISSMGRMTLQAMSVVAPGAAEQRVAPLAYSACFYLHRAARLVLAANMPDAKLRAISSFGAVLQNRSTDVGSTETTMEANEALFDIAVDGYGKSDQISVFRSFEAILFAVRFEIENDLFEVGSLKSTLDQISELIPSEILADAAGKRRLHVFPAYALGFEASIPALVESIAAKIKVDPERPWNDPFADLSEAAEEVRGHYRRLSSIDFQGTLLAKWVLDSLDAILKVLMRQIAHPPSGAEEFISTVVDDLKPLITWVGGFFPADRPAKGHHLSDATANLAVFGLDALDKGWPDIAQTCAETIERIADNVGGKISAYNLADIHVDLEVIARAGERTAGKAFAANVRSMISLPANLDQDSQKHHLEARATRFAQLDEAVSKAGRRPYSMKADPAERLHAFFEIHPQR